MADTFDLQRFKRVNTNLGKALVAGDFAFSAGFGATASVSTIEAGATDQSFQIVITSAGAGQAANPTCTLTFADGAFRNPDGSTYVPVAVACRGGGSQPTVQFAA